MDLLALHPPDYHDIATFDGWVRQRYDNTAAYIASFKDSYDCPQYNGTGQRYHISTFCSLVVRRSAALGCTGTPAVIPQQLCPNSCHAALTSLQDLFKNPAICNQQSGNMANQNRADSLALYESLCNSTQTFAATATMPCIVGEPSIDEHLNCGFSSVAERLAFCKDLNNDACCAAADNVGLGNIPTVPAGNLPNGNPASSIPSTTPTAGILPNGNPASSTPGNIPTAGNLPNGNPASSTPSTFPTAGILPAGNSGGTPNTLSTTGSPTKKPRPAAVPTSTPRPIGNPTNTPANDAVAATANNNAPAQTGGILQSSKTKLAAVAIAVLVIVGLAGCVTVGLYREGKLNGILKPNRQTKADKEAASLDKYKEMVAMKDGGGTRGGVLDDLDQFLGDLGLDDEEQGEDVEGIKAIWSGHLNSIEPKLESTGAVEQQPASEIEAKTYTAVANYFPLRDDEMEVRIGEKVQVSRIHDDGWAQGTNQSSGKEGIFPLVAVGRNDSALPSHLSVSADSMFVDTAERTVSLYIKAVEAGADKDDSSRSDLEEQW
ncbi:hypothetical protein SeLEV6574_g05379 [Synchytrium endobioticum]|uniref:SH3 domain-containing protein n=1 Tax=Synchytrium endobioticum TaxID=286115 RepID=A0A507CUL2_9FUNG|nr:hypothetical protein SeLEV6574_g05379 [Synchytrium endobioticum]